MKPALYSMVEAAGSVSVGLLLWYGGGEVLQAVIGIGTLVAFNEYIHRFFVPLARFQSEVRGDAIGDGVSGKNFSAARHSGEIANPQKPARSQTIPWRSGLRSGLVSLQARTSRY